MEFDDSEEQYKRIWERQSDPGRYVKERSEVWAALQQNMPGHRRRIPRWIGYAAAAAVLVAVVSTFLLERPRPASSSWAQLDNPGAQPRHFSLPDGSSVWLNAHSRLEYNGRNTRLTGEAYFSIAQDPEHPFTVSAAGLVTRVLGTVFNIDAYPGEQSVHVTLVSGSVGVQHGDQSLILKPGEVATFFAERGSLDRERLDLDDVGGWTTGKLVLEQVVLADAIHRITIRTGIPISISPALAKKQIKISGVYDLASIDSVLHAIAFAHRLRVVHQKDKFILTE